MADRAALHWIASYMYRPARAGDDLFAAHVLDVWSGHRRLNIGDVEWLSELEELARDEQHRRWARAVLEELCERAGEF